MTFATSRLSVREADRGLKVFRIDTHPRVTHNTHHRPPFLRRLLEKGTPKFADTPFDHAGEALAFWGLRTAIWGTGRTRAWRLSLATTALSFVVCLDPEGRWA